MSSVCSNCRTRIPTDKKRCPSCGTFGVLGKALSEIHKLSDVQASDLHRLQSGPWDLAWGGGIVTDSVSLFAGEAGSGKSTLLTQMAWALALQEKTTLYISKEETLGRVKSRAVRLGVPSDAQARILLVSHYTGTIRNVCESVAPALVIVDSLPALAGIGWGDVREAVATLTMIKEYADDAKCPAIVIDHINKKGEFSGPEAFAHLIDMTVFLKLDSHDKNMRYLIPQKNRDGDVNVCVSFLMTGNGLMYVAPTDSENDPEDEDPPESDV